MNTFNELLLLAQTYQSYKKDRTFNEHQLRSRKSLNNVIFSNKDNQPKRLSFIIYEVLLTWAKLGYENDINGYTSDDLDNFKGLLLVILNGNKKDKIDILDLMLMDNIDDFVSNDIRDYLASLIVICSHIALIQNINVITCIEHHHSRVINSICLSEDQAILKILELNDLSLTYDRKGKGRYVIFSNIKINLFLIPITDDEWISYAFDRV